MDCYVCVSHVITYFEVYVSMYVCVDISIGSFLYCQIACMYVCVHTSRFGLYDRRADA